MFDDRKVISRFWKRQGGRPDDVPPPPPSDDEGPVLDPGEETESLKHNKGDIGRQARRKLRREYRKDKVQLRRHWQTVGTKGAGAESDAESSSELSSASSSKIPRRKTRLAISDDEEDIPPLKKANAPPRAGSKARIPAASSDMEDDDDAHQVNSTLFVTPANNKQAAGVNGRSPVPVTPRTQPSATQRGKRPAPSSSTLTSDSDMSDSDSDSDAITAGPSCLAEAQPVNAPASTTTPSNRKPTGMSAIPLSTATQPAQKPPLAGTATPSSSATAAAAKKKDRPLAAASLQRVKNQLKPTPVLMQEKASTGIRGPPTPNRPTADTISGSTGATEAASAAKATAEPPATKAPVVAPAANLNSAAVLTAPTTQSTKAPPSTASGSLLDLIAGPVNARTANPQSPSTAPARGSGAPGATSTEAAVAKGSYRGAHKNLSRIGLLPDAPPPMLAKRGSVALRGRGGHNVAPANASGHVAPSAAAVAAKGGALSVATASKDAAPAVSGVAAAAPSIAQTAPPTGDDSMPPQIDTVASAAPSTGREALPAANAPDAYADEGQDFADLSVPPQAPNKDPAGHRGDASPARPSAVPNTPTRPRTDSRAERGRGNKVSLEKATGSNAAPLGQSASSKAGWEKGTSSNAAPLGQPEPSPTWRNRPPQSTRTPPWQHDSWLERPKWWGQSRYAGVWYSAHQRSRDRQSRRSSPAQGPADRHWDPSPRDAAPHEPHSPPPAQPPPPPSSSSSPSAPSTHSRPPQLQDQRRAKLLTTGQEAGSGNSSPRSPAFLAERNGSGSGNASPYQPAPPGAGDSAEANGSGVGSGQQRREGAPPRAPQWMETWAKNTGTELVPPPPLRMHTRFPWEEEQPRRAYARLPW